MKKPARTVYKNKKAELIPNQVLLVDLLFFSFRKCLDIYSPNLKRLLSPYCVIITHFKAFFKKNPWFSLQKIDLKTIIFFLFSCLNVIVRFLHKITAIDFLQNP